MHCPDNCRLIRCKEFKSKDPPQKGRVLEEVGGCRLCTGGTHNIANSRVRSIKSPCGAKIAKGPCSEWHHKRVHLSESEYCRTRASTEVASRRDNEQERKEAMEQGKDVDGSSTTDIKRLLAVFTIPVSSQTGCRSSSKLVLEDPASTENLITHEVAEKLGLPSKPMTLPVKVVEEMHTIKYTKIYRMCLADMQGRKREIKGIGMDSLTKVSQMPEI